MKRWLLIGSLITAFLMTEEKVRATPPEFVEPDTQQLYPDYSIDDDGVNGDDVSEAYKAAFADGINTQNPPSQYNDVYTVQKGDSLWKIAVKYQIGLSEIIAANSHFKNPALIYPGDKVYVPNMDSVKGVEQAVLALVNKERAKGGLPGLTMNWELQRVARYKSADMANRNYFSHDSPTYGSPFQMMKHYGISYSYAGENIAKGQPTPEAVMQAWMNSPGHRQNIMSPNFTQIGVGLYKEGITCFWTQQFIKP